MKDGIDPRCVKCVKCAVRNEETHPEGLIQPPYCLLPIEDLDLGRIIRERAGCPILTEVIRNKLADVEPRIEVEYKKLGGKYDKTCHIERSQARAKLDESFCKLRKRAR